MPNDTQEVKEVKEEPKEEKKEEIKIRELTVNIRREVLKAPIQKRAKKAIKVLREIVEKIVKNKEVKLSARLNEYIWSRGIRKPPTKIPIKIVEKEDKAYVDLNR